MYCWLYRVQRQSCRSPSFQSTIATFAMALVPLLGNLLLITAAFTAPSGDISIESCVARRRSQPLWFLDAQTPTSNISHVALITLTRPSTCPGW